MPNGKDRTEPKPTQCGICGELMREGDIAEMYDPKLPSTSRSILCHPDCGLNDGLEIA
jgi:hypothetical protein